MGEYERLLNAASFVIREDEEYYPVLKKTVARLRLENGSEVLGESPHGYDLARANALKKLIKILPMRAGPLLPAGQRDRRRRRILDNTEYRRLVL